MTPIPSFIVQALTESQSQWVANLKGATDEYKNEFLPKYYDLIAKYYSDREGPYLLGDEVSYTDFAIYQSIDNDTRTKTIPVGYISLDKFVIVD